METYSEHHNYPNGVEIPENIILDLPCYIKFRGDKHALCVEIKESRKLHTIYYIGVDWINSEFPIYVEPKLNKDQNETNYLLMLLNAFKHPDVVKNIDNLVEIKFDKPEIEINQQQDLLTPLLTLVFLSTLKEIVRKGLKKSYYKVERNLNSRIKGKVLVSQTIKKNILKNKLLNTYCSFEEFGFNGYENRLLKKALNFVERYLPVFLKKIEDSKETNKNDASGLFNYIKPAFESVTDEVNLNEIKHSKKNVFYKEYGEALKLAKIILRRFGYNITTAENQIIKTPPFWIDMSKLFELYVLGLLKDRFKEQIKFHHSTYGNELDYLLDTEDLQMVIDAKYKKKYLYGYDTDDMRQVSGYARLKNVHNELNIDQNKIIDCLIIYPDQNGYDDLTGVDLKEQEIDKYVSIYKVGVKLPQINKI